MDTEARYEEAKLRMLQGAWNTEEAALEVISFAISEPDAGEIDSTLQIGNDTFPIVLSDVYPPFQDMLAWLERLIAGDSPCVLYVDDEHDDHFFRVTRTLESDRCIFEYLVPVRPAGGLYRRAHVGFVAFVQQFHAALESLMAIDFEAEAAKEGGTRIFFNLESHSDEIIQLDLSVVRAFLAGEGA